MLKVVFNILIYIGVGIAFFLSFMFFYTLWKGFSNSLEKQWRFISKKYKLFLIFSNKELYSDITLPIVACFFERKANISNGALVNQINEHPFIEYCHFYLSQVGWSMDIRTLWGDKRRIDFLYVNKPVDIEFEINEFLITSFENYLSKTSKGSIVKEILVKLLIFLVTTFIFLVFTYSLFILVQMFNESSLLK